MLARSAGTSHNLSIIQVYAPTADSTDEELISLYKDLNGCIQDIPRKDILMLVADWNAKVEPINNGWQATIGKYGYGKCSDREEALLGFTLDDMVTLFQRRECRNWTQQSPNQHTTNMIDLILINRNRATMQNLPRCGY